MLIQYFFAIYNSLCDGPSAESMQPTSWTCLLLFRYSLFTFLFRCCSIEEFRKNDLETHTTNSFDNYYYCRTAPVPSIILPMRNWGTNDENDNILIWKSLSRLISRQSLLFFFSNRKTSHENTPCTFFVVVVSAFISNHRLRVPRTKTTITVWQKKKIKWFILENENEWWAEWTICPLYLVEDITALRSWWIYKYINY